MLTLYHYPLSPCSEKIRYALAIKGLSWHEVHLDLSKKENLSEEYLAINPAGCIPALVAGTDVVVESTTILDYLEALAPYPSLTPVAPMARAKMRLWTKWVDETLHPAWPGIAWVVLIRPRWIEAGHEQVMEMVAQLPDPSRRDRQLILYRKGFASPQSHAAFSTFSKTIELMANDLEDRPFLCGDTPSLADVSVLPYFVTADYFGLLGEDGVALPETLIDWYARMRSRPSLAETLQPQITTQRAEQLRSAGHEALKALT